MTNPMKSLLAATLAAGLAAPVFAAEPTADTVVATVGGEDITLGQMIVMSGQLPKQYQQLDDKTLFKAVRDQLVRQTAVAETVKDKLSKEAKIALENQRRSFIANEALNAIAEAAVTDEAVQKAYDEQYANAEPVQEYNASHILVETEDEAKAVKAQLEDGADFADLAKEKSTGPSAKSGGELGWFSEGMMVKPFEQAAMAMKKGDISDPVKTQFGWHIIKLNDTRDKPTPKLEDVRKDIVKSLQQAAVSAAIEDITAKADIQKPETDIDPAAVRNKELLND